MKTKTKTKIIIGVLVSGGLMAIPAIVGIVSLWEYAGAGFRSPEIRKINDRALPMELRSGKIPTKTAVWKKALRLKKRIILSM